MGSKKRKPAIDRRIDAQIAVERAAREAQAVGGEAAPDTVEIGGVRLFVPTLAHMWFYNRLAKSPLAMPSLIDFAACIVAALTMPAKEVRHTLMPAIDKGNLVTLCYGRLIDWGIEAETVNEAYARLWQPWVDKQKTKAGAEGNAQAAAASSPDGGDESSTPSPPPTTGARRKSSASPGPGSSNTSTR